MGGAMNGVVLYLRARRRRLTLLAGILIGALHGMAWGSVALEIDLWIQLQIERSFTHVQSHIDPVINPSVGETPAIPQGVLGEIVGLMAIVSLLAGCWHGWRMTRYLQARSREAQEEPSESPA
jgi:hypothetical protein